ncbi:MAG TPA: hypothetical protein VII56_23135 [Rhizomicrobium sp.]
MKPSTKNANPTYTQPSAAKEGDDSAVKILACLARINDPMTVYLLEMLIDRIADLASARERGEVAAAGLSMQ